MIRWKLREPTPLLLDVVGGLVVVVMVGQVSTAEEV